ncbi:hypothetical protein [Halosimplex halobium]|uniref:hypothetical protein n=1 Tax=Halosimplex halobium TaxID=3396618 RepID=UPI003F57F973
MRTADGADAIERIAVPAQTRDAGATDGLFAAASPGDPVSPLCSMAIDSGTVSVSYRS